MRWNANSLLGRWLWVAFVAKLAHPLILAVRGRRLVLSASQRFRSEKSPLTMPPRGAMVCAGMKSYRYRGSLPPNRKRGSGPEARGCRPARTPRWAEFRFWAWWLPISRYTNERYGTPLTYFFSQLIYDTVARITFTLCPLADRDRDLLVEKRWIIQDLCRSDNLSDFREGGQAVKHQILTGVI